MNVAEFQQTLPLLPDDHEWRVSTYMIDTFKFGWELQIIHTDKGGWFGLFDKHTRVREAMLTTYVNILPEKELRQWAVVLRNQLKESLDTRSPA